ncbi:MAG: membrane protein insertion efficiency factor YidD [Desulfobacterales bacterium]|nr:membrane protein insertion efficiency factor YidD [Desulfobacterales bacterium]
MGRLISHMTRIKIILIIYFFVSAGTAMAQDNPMNGPWGNPEVKVGRCEQPGAPANTAASWVKTFRKYISPIDGSNCPMYPSCSRYSIECFEKHGFVKGWVMTWDRLYRCGRDELRLSPQIALNGQEKCSDPVENNDFWWSNGK